MKLNDQIISKVASWITIATGLIAIVNFIYSLTHGVYGLTVSVPAVPQITLPFRLIVLILLESALGYAFGWLLVETEKRGSGIPMIMLWVISLISAWTSLFNIQWILVGGTPAEFEFVSTYTLWFFVSTAIALIIAIYLIDTHVKQQQANQVEINGIGDLVGPVAQVVCFVIMFIIYLYGT